MKILVLNGSIHGGQKNSGVVLEILAEIQKGDSSYSDIQIDVCHLADGYDLVVLEQRILSAHALILLTGTYWDSWGSPMQKFLELSTEWEGNRHFFCKAFATIVTMHSVGGKGVLSRLQGVMNTLGCLSPPMSGVVLSQATEIANKLSQIDTADFWKKKDLETMFHNLVQITRILNREMIPFKKWEVESENFNSTWLEN